MSELWRALAGGRWGLMADERIESRTQEDALALAKELAGKIRALLMERPGVCMRGWDDGSTWVDVDYGPAHEGCRSEWYHSAGADVSGSGGSME